MTNIHIYDIFTLTFECAGIAFVFVKVFFKNRIGVRFLNSNLDFMALGYVIIVVFCFERVFGRPFRHEFGVRRCESL